MAQIPQEYSDIPSKLKQTNKANIVKVLTKGKSNNELAVEIKIININYSLAS